MYGNKKERMLTIVAILLSIAFLLVDVLVSNIIQGLLIICIMAGVHFFCNANNKYLGKKYRYRRAKARDGLYRGLFALKQGGEANSSRSNLPGLPFFSILYELPLHPLCPFCKHF
jgi:fatty-acid desaturase